MRRRTGEHQQRGMGTRGGRKSNTDLDALEEQVQLVIASIEAARDFRHPREINKELVDAYLARRALDYLVGFTLSPVLWRKLPGARPNG